jgi:hypothetical protein
MIGNVKSIVLLTALSVVFGQAEAVQRAHVSALSGVDSNTAFNCDVAHPCRFFQAATTVVDVNGEVVVLDSGGYGAVTLSQSISLNAPPGVYAGISVFPGANGITVATPGINVVLRGITINSQGGTAGVLFTDGTSLSVENCVISNFSNGFGVRVQTAAKVKVIDSVFRDNNNGVTLESGAIAGISHTRFLGTTNAGVLVNGNVANLTTIASISNSTFESTGNFAVRVYSATASANARAAIYQSTISNSATGYSGYGLSSETYNSGVVLLTVSQSSITGNGIGLRQAGATATLKSLGNNTIEQNSFADFLGTITAGATK